MIDLIKMADNDNRLVPPGNCNQKNTIRVEWFKDLMRMRKLCITIT